MSYERSIRFHQSARLERYFSARYDGAGYGEPWSRMVAVLERGPTLIPCRMCGGRRRRLPGVNPPEWQEVGGCGWVTRSGGVPSPRQTDWQRWALRALNLPRPEPAEFLCPSCHGRGWVPSKRRRSVRREDVTAWPTGSSKHGDVPSAGTVLADPSGEVTRWLSRLGSERLTLEVWFRSGREKLMLWALTPAGTRLLRQCPDDLEERCLHPIQWLDNERAAAREQERHRNRALIEAAELQALDLLERAAASWNRVCPTEREQQDATAERSLGLAEPRSDTSTGTGDRESENEPQWRSGAAAGWK
jgi:hypothetical protein